MKRSHNGRTKTTPEMLPIPQFESDPRRHLALYEEGVAHRVASTLTQTHFTLACTCMKGLPILEYTPCPKATGLAALGFSFGNPRLACSLSRHRIDFFWVTLTCAHVSHTDIGLHILVIFWLSSVLSGAQVPSGTGGWNNCTGICILCVLVLAHAWYLL